MEKRLGVSIHSFNLQSRGWLEIMWGKPPDFLGRLTKGLEVALKEGAEILFLGNGLRSGINGEMESEFNRQYILDNFDRLSEFTEFQGIDLRGAKRKIEQILMLDRVSLNTTEEVISAGHVFEGAGIERVISVSSRTHAPRCLNEALKFYGRPGSKILVHNVSVQVGDTGWAPNDDVVVFEPSSRPDDLIGDLRQKMAKLLLRPEELMKIKKALGL